MGNADGFFTLGSSLPVTLRQVLDLDPDLVSASVSGLVEQLRPESGERRSVGTFPIIYNILKVIYGIL